MGELDKQVEAIRQAMRERINGAFADEKGQDWKEDFNSNIERTVKYRNLDASRPGHMGDFFEGILRAELSVMVDNYHSAMHFSHFLNTHSEVILQAIYKRLRERHINGRPAPIFIQKPKIRHYLNRLNHVFQAKLARGEEISAIPYLEKPKKAVSVTNPEMSKKGRGKSKKNKARKQGRKQALMGFESIKAAADGTEQNYNTLKSMKRRHELKDSI